MSKGDSHKRRSERRAPPQKILIVDDNSTNLYLLKALLEGHGLSVTMAGNGKEALDQARRNPPDLIVTDILMPVMDGYALCRAWKADERLRHIPLLFYTATYTDPKDEAFALDLGADRFIVKPQEPDVMMGLINEVLDEARVPERATAIPLGEEMQYFRQYNEVLFKKLEKKMADLEEANQKLKLMEDLYRLSFENISETVFLIDSDLNILSVSPSVEKILGYKPQDFIGRPVSCLSHILSDETYARAMEDASLVLKGETIPETIYRAVAADGTEKNCEVSGAPMKRDGRIVGIISVARDVSDRLRAQENVRKSEKRYRELYDFLPIPVYEMDLEGNIIAANSAIYELFGGSESDLEKGFNVWRTLSPADRDKSLGNMQMLLKGRKVSGTEYVLTRIDGSVFPAIVISSVIYSDGKPAGLRGAIIDISERRKQEEELRRMNMFLDSIIENIPDMIFIKDAAELRFVRINRAGEELIGLTRENLLGKNDYDFFPKEQADFFTGKDRDVLCNGKLIDIPEERIQTGKGERILHTKKLPILNEKGEAEYLLGISEDITDRKQAEEALRESEIKFKDLSEKSNVGIYLIQDGLFRYVNATFAGIFGYEIDEMTNLLGPKDVVLPEDMLQVEENLQKRLSGAVKSVHYDFRILTKQRSVRRVEVLSSATIYKGMPAAIGTLLDITDRKQAEEQLKESEDRYRSVFVDHSAVKFLIEPDSGRIVEANDAAVKYYGWSHEQIRQMKIQDINTLPPEDVRKEIEMARTKERTHFEFRHRRADGSIRDVEVFSGTIDTKGKRLLHSIVHDITERKRSEALYQVLAESSMGAVFIVQDGKFRFINKNAIAYTGYTEDLRDRDADIMIHPEDKAMCSAFAREMLKGTRTTAYEYRIVTKENRTRWISQILTPIIYDGRPALLGNALDVTDLKESQNRLAEMKALESSIMSAIPHVVVGLENDHILFVNDAVETVFGWKPEELIGHSLEILCQDDNACRDLVGEFRAEIVNESACRQEAEIQCRHRDGRNIVCKVTSCRTGDTASDKTVATFEDVTSEKMSHIQLLQAEKMASIGKLAAGVAHEINNPTAFVSSNLKTLSEYVQDIITVKDQYRTLIEDLNILKPGESFPGTFRNQIQQIKELESRLNIDMVMEDIVALISESRDGTGRIARIVQDLKNFAHPGEEKETSFNINENIESTLNIVWNELKYKAVVHKDYGDIPRIMGYPQQLNQVFMNLLVNAAQAIKEKGEIRIATRMEDSFIIIKISDTGMGIPPENIPRLFDPFFTTKEVGKGTGLGLHVAYSIIEKHNGTISVESTVGVGTTFTLRIPISNGH